MNNPCIECGKQRIDGRSWVQKSGISSITHTLTICPDPICQKIVDEATDARKAKAENLAKKKLQVKSDREKLIVLT